MEARSLVLVETSCWIEALRKDGRLDVREKVRQLMTDGTAAWCEMILLELWNGARGDREKSHLKQLQEEIPVLPITAEVWRSSFDLARQCRRLGHTIPVADLLIFSCGRHHRASIESMDADFELLRRLAPPV